MPANELVEPQGKTWGQPMRLDEHAVQKIMALRAAGRSLRDIAMALKVPLATVARAARSSVKKVGS